MRKTSKVNLAITVDTWVSNWLNEQKEKRSTLINQILIRHIHETSTKPQKTLIEMSPEEKKEGFQKRWERINAMLDAMEDSE